MKLSPDEEALLRLSLIPGVGPKTLHNLLSKFPRPNEIFHLDHGVLIRKYGLGLEFAEEIQQAKLNRKAEDEMEKAEKLNINLLTCFSDKFPSLLKEVPNYPPVLFCKGNPAVLDHFCVAFVGSRKAGFYGKKSTQRLIRDFSLVDSRISIISGLATGIDSIAHRAAIENRLPTVGVLGGGLNRIYPRENIGLSEEIIAENGLLLSEYSCDTRPLGKQFPMRNRIISGISKAVMIMEAAEKSGALITAGFALEQNREVFALPGPADALSYRGCNRLIQKGEAKLLMEVSDVIEEFSFSGFSKREKFAENEYQRKIDFEEENKDMDESKKAIIELLRGVEMSSDEISGRLKIPVSKLLAMLTELEMNGLVACGGGGNYTSG